MDGVASTPFGPPQAPIPAGVILLKVRSFAVPLHDLGSLPRRVRCNLAIAIALHQPQTCLRSPPRCMTLFVDLSVDLSMETAINA